MTAPKTLHVIGAASSAGAYGPGQEETPQTFRRYGLITALQQAGCHVTDVGDVAHATYTPDPDHPAAGSVQTVVDVCRAVAESVAAALRQKTPALVLGGDCTIELGTLTGALETSDSIGLVYIDGDTDLHTPATGDGILDWMGAAHILGLPDADPALTGMARRSPMLPPDAISFVAAENVTDPEQRVVTELGLHSHSLTECRSDPNAVVDALAAWASNFTHLLVHVDIDVLDGAAFPIADNTRTTAGLTLNELGQLLDRLCHYPNFAALTICEINPRNARDEQKQFEELTKMLTTVLRPDGGDLSLDPSDRGPR